jgi:hypothetical protein
MTENTKGQNRDQQIERDTENSENVEQRTSTRSNVQADREGSANLDEKSSGLGRRHKNSGIATKDGTTGSDYDGQVTDR